ncbi:MAG: ATP-binding protein [bacterium]
MPPLAIVIILIWAYATWYSIVKYRLMVLTPALGANEIVERVMDLVVLVDNYENIISTNPKARELTRYNEEELVGKPLKILLEKEIKNGFICESFLKTKNNEYIPMQVSISSVKDKYGDRVGKVIVGQDLRQMKQLEAVTKELEAFSYSVAHDLRAPLRGMRGFSKALMEDCEKMLPEDGKGYFKRIEEEGKRMDEIIEDLLSLSYVGKFEMYTKMVNLSILVEDIANRLKGSEPGRNVEFVIKKDVFAQGDSNLLKICLENLIGNAWKFSSRKEKAIIEFGTENINDKIAYFVKDNGAGFDINYKDKLFLPFERLHSRDEFPGSGIGLTIVKRIMDRHNGKIWAESENGAKFCFTLTK